MFLLQIFQQLRCDRFPRAAHPKEIVDQSHVKEAGISTFSDASNCALQENGNHHDEEHLSLQNIPNGL